MKNNFVNTYKLIMESIDLEWSDLFNQIKNNSNADMLNDWVEEIDNQFNSWIDEASGNSESVADIPVEFTIDDMEKFDEILSPEHLDAIKEIGIGILHAIDEDEEVVDECECGCGGKCGDDCKCKDKKSFDVIVDEDDEQDAINPDEEIVDEDLENSEDTDQQADNNSDDNTIEESHIPFSSFVPVYTVDGEDTGWRMGPSDFSGRKRNPMKCSLDPEYTIAKDETIMINPKFPEQRIALTSYYKAADGDSNLINELEAKFDLHTNLNL